VPAASLSAFDIDTSNFSGNEGPAGSVEGVYAPDREPTNDDAEVGCIVPSTARLPA
jgi:allantoicase